MISFPTPALPARHSGRGACLCCALAILSSAVGGAAEFHTPAAVTSPNSTSYYALTGLHQGPGIGYQAAPPHDGITGTGQTWVTNQSGGGNYYTNAPAPIVILDLGANRYLTEISTWGYADGNANGVRTFNLRFATDAEGPSGFGVTIPGQDNFTANQSPVTRHSHPLAPVTARYVEFTATANYYGVSGAGPGGDRVGLGEIGFENTGPGVDPYLETLENLTLDLDGTLQTFGLDLHNGGATQDLMVSSAVIGGANAAAFSMISTPPSIAPGATGQALVSFHPAGLSGAVAATVTFTTNDTSAPARTVRLEGYLHDPRLVAPPTLDFGALAPDAPVKSLSLTVSNAGNLNPLHLTAATLGGDDPSSFAVDFAPLTVPPGGSTAITVSFDPAAGNGTRAATLTFASDDPRNPSLTVNLTGRAVRTDPVPAIRINELVASNTTGLQDGTGARPDWIELFNAGDTAVDLAGWHLTDDSGNLTKWTFPAKELAPGAYLVVFASGNGQPDPAGNLHADFSLSAAGEYLALVKPDGITVASEFHPTYPPQFSNIGYGRPQTGSVAESPLAGCVPSILVPPDGTLGITWTARAFSPDAGWFQGTGLGVGYDTNPSGADYNPLITTNVRSRIYDVSPRKPGLYIRYPFEIADKQAITSVTLRMRWDDGFVAYLNGVEVARRNAPATPVWNSLAAANASPEPTDETIDLTAFAGNLENGTNILAIHGMNGSLSSSDLLMLPDLTITRPAPVPDISGYLPTPTPGAANSSAANPGPDISAVAPSPAQPVAGQPTTITAALAQRLAPVASVTLIHRTGYGAEATLPMLDDGSGADAVAGDGVFTAVIPAAAHTAGDMLRWAVSATDTSTNTSRAPAYLLATGNRQSPQYFGTVIPGVTGTSQLAHFQWFTQSTSASHSRSGARASVFFAGRFYDNVFVRQRGGATNGTVSQKFEFNKGGELYINDTMPAVTEINLNGNGSDSTYARQPLGFQTYQIAGNVACNCDLWEMSVNKVFDRVGVFVEQMNEEFLERNGLDPLGDLYKVNATGLAPGLSDTSSGYEKKTGNKADYASINTFVAGLTQATSDDRRRYVIDHLDLPQVLNFLALRSITQDADDVRKNFSVYQDSRGDQRWRIFPWDKDWTFGITGDGGTWLPHPFFGGSDYAKQNANQWNQLYDILFDETTTRRLYLRRLRTLMDSLLQPASTPQAERILEARGASIISPAAPRLGTSLASINSYLDSRRNVLANNYPDLIPASQPANPAIAITGAEFNPVSSNQNEEHIVLHNPEATEIDVSGWSLAGAARYTFPPGTVIERGGNLYVCADTLAFRNRAVSPHGNEERIAVGPYSGRLSNYGNTIELHDAANALVSTHTTPVQPSDAQLYLVVSELLYHPAPDAEAEFIEVTNISPTLTLDLAGVRFVSGISFTFPSGTTLDPGASAVVVRNEASFAAAYGSATPIAGNYAGSALSNSGERIKLEDAGGGTIADFTYGITSPWPAAGNGAGSIVLMRPETRPDPNTGANWRLSVAPLGTPGGTDALRFTGDPLGDSNANGRADLLDYALGEAPVISTAWTDDGFTLATPLVPNADDAVVSAEYSVDLIDWRSAVCVGVERGAAVFGLPQDLPQPPRAFMRLSVTARPGPHP
ncbi:MAG: lamin tail domain-containing protein [Verrucomicrobia bacterium]|nr:lamin tail domain-containing protein [Verrucomicrobiota bacterium]